MSKTLVVILMSVVFTGCASKQYVTIPKEEFQKMEETFKDRLNRMNAEVQRLEKQELLLRFEHNKELFQVQNRMITAVPKNTECKFLCF